jgi:hypothetical protein
MALKRGCAMTIKKDYRILFIEAQECEMLKYYCSCISKGDLRDKNKIYIEWIVANAKAFRDNFVKIAGFDPLV